MTERAEGTIVVAAPPARVMDVLEDFESYPVWAQVRDARVLERGEGGRATRVRFELDVPGLGHADYVLAYRYAPGDAGMSWTSVEANGAVSGVAGEYLLAETDDGATSVTYRLDVELAVLLPGVVRTKGQELLIANALGNLKRRVEGR
ncbi:MAG: SRPBCC family protein [Actinomycetota bacterium]